LFNIIIIPYIEEKDALFLFAGEWTPTPPAVSLAVSIVSVRGLGNNAEEGA